jgi:hypothetical protein
MKRSRTDKGKVKQTEKKKEKYKHRNIPTYSNGVIYSELTDDSVSDGESTDVSENEGKPNPCPTHMTRTDEDQHWDRFVRQHPSPAPADRHDPHDPQPDLLRGHSATPASPSLSTVDPATLSTCLMPFLTLSDHTRVAAVSWELRSVAGFPDPRVEPRAPNAKCEVWRKHIPLPACSPDELRRLCWFARLTSVALDKTNDSHLRVLGQARTLTRLDAGHCSASDDGVRHLQGMALQHLELTGLSVDSPLTERGLTQLLASLGVLTHLAIYKTHPRTYHHLPGVHMRPVPRPRDTWFTCSVVTALTRVTTCR